MNKLITSLIVVLTAANINAQQLTELPKLVVGISVDQLRSDYLQFLFKAFGEKGFKRLIQNGVFYEDVEFAIEYTDRASTMATVYTGAYPYHNGIISSSIFNSSNLRIESIFNDIAFMGNYTSQTVSPKAIKSSTLADELKISSKGFSRVYSVAPEMEQAIIGAGHAANGAFWIENISGRWASSTFYNEIPFYIERYNRTDGIEKRIDNTVWQPLKPITEYSLLPYCSDDWNFKHSFSGLKKDKYKIYKTSGVINQEINKIAELLISKEGLGQRAFPDFISLSYNAGTYLEGNNDYYSLEIQDTYLRLDNDIADLLEIIDKNVGLNNTFIFLTSSGNLNNEDIPAERFNIPYGEFRPDRCTALLNTYLMALYGQENWVVGYNNQQIYLNNSLIEDRKIDVSDIQSKAAEFVIQFSGVQDVVTSLQLLHGNWNENTKKFRNSFSKNISGDLILSIQPGWQIVFDNGVSANKTIRRDAIKTPFILFHPSIKGEKIVSRIDATEIAPTVSKVLRIRSPNACNTAPLF